MSAPKPDSHENTEPSTTRSKSVELRNKRGLHARAASKFVQTVVQFTSQIEVTSQNDVGSETVVGDSIMELLMLGSACGESITISATGPDAERALAALTALVESRFGEED